MAFAARRSGVEMSALNTGIRTMQQRMVAAGAVSKQLGISFDHLRGLSPEDQFKEVGKALAGIRDPAQRSALAAELFGRQGPRIAQMAADFEGLAAEAHNLGVVMTDGALATAERFNDVMGDIKQKLQAVFVNSLPDIQMFMQAAWAGMVRVYDIAVAVGTALFSAFQKDNFLPLVYNIIEAMNVGFVNAFENLKRLMSATIKWIQGQGWSFEGVGLMEGAKFQEVPALTQLGKDIVAANDKYNASIDRIAEQRAAAERAVIKGAQGDGGGGTAVRDRQRGLEAARFGSVEAARAINRMRGGGSSIEQRQLSALDRIARNTEDLVGGVTVIENEI
jgi:hypothetical protein